MITGLNVHDFFEKFKKQKTKKNVFVFFLQKFSSNLKKVLNYKDFDIFS